MIGYQIFDGLFAHYTSPLIVIISITIVLLVINKALKKPIVSKISMYSFPVYIIHGNRLIYDYLINNSFKWISQYNFILGIVIVLVLGILIYIVCMFIDFIRIRIFDFCRINNIISKVGTKLDEVLLWKK